MTPLYSKAKEYFEMPPVRNGMEVIELRALTHGLPPKAVKSNLNAFYEEWATNGVDAWNTMTEKPEIFLSSMENEAEKNRMVGWWNLPEVVGDRFISPLLHAPRDTCIMMANATQIVFSLLSCKELNKPGRRKVICTDGEFPAVLHTLQHFNKQFEAYAFAKEVQLDICVVKMGDNPFDEQKILDEIDDSTVLVIFSHIGFVRGERVTDSAIKAITKKSHDHGSLIAIDGYHAIGNHTIHVEELGVDAYFGGLLKEGCGSSGNCFLYVRPGLELTPSLSGWFGDKKPFVFAQKPEKNQSIRRRFLTGTTPIAPLYHAVEGLKIMFDIGLEEVATDVLDKVETTTKFFMSKGIQMVSPTIREKMSSLIVIQAPEANKLREYLVEEHGILVDARRNEYLRMAAHVYNSQQELDKASHIIVDAMESKEYLEYVIDMKDGPVT